MARKKLPPRYDVSGKSIQDLIETDFNVYNRMNVRDLKAVASRLVSATNKRIRRLEKSGLSELSPALQHLYDKGVRNFSITNLKDENEVRHTLSAMIKFLKLETSSITSFNRLRKKTYKRLGIKFGSWTIEEEKEFWRNYRKLQEDLGGESNVKKSYDSHNLQFTFAKKYEENDKLISNEDITNFSSFKYESTKSKEMEIEDDELEDEFGW